MSARDGTGVVPHVKAGQPRQLRTARPDLEVRRLLRQLRLGGAAGQELTVERVRRAWRLGVYAFGSREAVDSVHDEVANCATGRVRVRIYHPADASGVPAIVWYHGGGFVFGGLGTADGTCRALANRTGACVISVDYRLAPEHSLTEARDDCLGAAEWVMDNAARLGIDPNRIAVAGDSAGGAWAALVSHSWRRSTPLICQLLVYPATELGATYEPSDIGQALTLDHEHIVWLQEQIALSSRLDDPQLSPIHQTHAQPAPPTVLLTAGFDYLLAEGLEYARRILVGGTPVTLLHYPGQMHGFLSFDRVLAGGVDAIDRLGAVFRILTAGESAPLGWDVRPPYATRRDRWRWTTPRQRGRELGVAWTVLRETRRTYRRS